MPKLLHAIISSLVITDGMTNAISYIQVLDGGWTKTVPSNMPPFYYSAEFEFSPQDDNVLIFRLHLKSPSGEIRDILDKQTIELAKDVTKHRLGIALKGMPISEFGRHEFILQIFHNDRWKSVSALPFNIRKLDEKLTNG